MKKIILLITYCCFINTYNSSESILENENNISVYTLNANHEINKHNSLHKTIVLKDQTGQKQLRNLSCLSSLLLSNMVHHDTQAQRNYILGDENTLPLILKYGSSGFLADNLFLQLHNTNYPEKLKIFATGAYNYPKFDTEIANILKQPEFINNNISKSSLTNNDDISTYNNTTYYNPYLIDKIIPHLSKELQEEKHKNIPIQHIGGIAIKLLNWLGHCYEQNTFESIVFLPKKMSGVCQAIYRSLKENNIIKKGEFIYIADTNEIKEYCKMIQNEAFTQKISINKNLTLEKERIPSLICLPIIDYYCNIIKPLGLFELYATNIKSQELKDALYNVVNKITHNYIIFSQENTNTIFMRLLDIIETNYIEYEDYGKNKFINYLHNIIISSCFADHNISWNIIHNTKYPFILANSSPFQSLNIINDNEEHGNYITTRNKGFFYRFFDRLIDCPEISAEEKLCSLAKIAYYFCMNKTKIEIDSPLLSPTIDFILSCTEILLHEKTKFMTYIKDLNLKLKNNEIDKISWAKSFFDKASKKIREIIIDKKNTATIEEIGKGLNTTLSLTNNTAKKELLYQYMLFAESKNLIPLFKCIKICNLIIEYDKKYKNNTDTYDDYDNLKKNIQDEKGNKEPEIINQQSS
jgi:hypothetical protein